MWKQMLRRQGSLRRGRSRSLALEASIWRRFSTCPLTSLSSSSPPALGGGNPTRRAAEINFYSYVKYEANIYACKYIYICSCLWICVFHTYVTCLHLALGFNGVWRGSRWHWSRSCAKRSVVIFVLLIYNSWFKVSCLLIFHVIHSPWVWIFCSGSFAVFNGAIFGL